MPMTATSAEVRAEVEARLASDTSFCGDGGRFGSPLCDWFVIGGRWSGYLAEITMGSAYDQALQSECPELAGKFFTQDAIERNRDKLTELWSRFGGKGVSPYLRDAYSHYGDEDDAMKVDRAIYDAVLRRYSGESECGHVEFMDLDGDPVRESFIDRKWVAVIDYHN
jgi:hypothetical protein